jgi:predicted nucleic acid-binding protein
MKACFADTFFFLALLNAKDPTHQRALALNRINRPIVTTWFILLELADHLCDVQNRRLFPQVLDAIEKDSRFDLMEVDPALLADAVSLYNDRPDQEWSLTDCTSFVVMRSRGIT